jgi:hypothetical protein
VYDGYDDGYLDEKAHYCNDVEYLPPLEADAGTVSSRSGASFASSVDGNGENLHYGPLSDKQIRRNKTVKKIKLTKGHLVPRSSRFFFLWTSANARTYVGSRHARS